MKDLVITGELAVDLAAVFDASLNPYVLLTPDLTITGLNQAYLNATSSKREALIGQPLFGAFTAGPGEDAPENVRQVRASIERAIEARQPDHLAVVKFAVLKGQPDGSASFEDRLWTATHTPILSREGEVMYVLQHTTDITELEELRKERARGVDIASASALDSILGGDLLRRANHIQADNRRLEFERNRLVELFMQTPGFVAVLSGPDHVFQMHNAAYAQLIGHRDVAGKSVSEAMPEVVSQGYIDFLDQVYRSGEAYEGRQSRVLLQRTPDTPLEELFLNFIYQPVRDDDGQVIGIFVQGHDVTNDVIAAERQKLMIDELNHRVKNTLATVQSIAMQTARSHDDPHRFAQAFQARLLSLSHTHNLLTRSHWEGADLRDVLRHETDIHGASRVAPNGPSVALSPAQALSLGMIFHELATNAAKYGALSVADGRVLVDWQVSRQDEPTLSLIWKEVGGPVVEEPTRRGFGARLIERNMRHDLAGSLEVHYASDGLIVEMAIPVERGDR